MVKVKENVSIPFLGKTRRDVFFKSQFPTKFVLKASSSTLKNTQKINKLDKKKDLGTNSKFLEWKTLMKSKISPVKMLIDLVKYPVINEKSYFLFYKKKQYTFDVDLRLTKVQIKKLFEDLFKIDVISINTHIPPRKKIRGGVSFGYKPQVKRVILTLKEGQFINYL